MRPIEPTKFLTRTRKKIFMSKPKRGSSKQVFFTLGNAGKKGYAPKAYFAQNNSGNNNTIRTIKPQNKVPNKLAPKLLPKGSRPKKVSAPSNMAPANARRARMNLMAARRANGSLKTAAMRARAAPVARKTGGRKARSPATVATNMFAKILNMKPTVRKVRKNKGVPRKAAKSPNNELKASQMFAKILNKKAPVRKPRVARKAKSPNNELKASQMFAKILNKKAPVRKPRAPKKAALTPAMKLLLKINAENRRIIAKNKALLKKVGRKANSPETKATKMFAKILNKKAPVRKAPMKKRVNNMKKNIPANNNPFAMLMKKRTYKKRASKK